MNYPTLEVMIEKLKKYFGWDDDMVEFVKKSNGLQLQYRIMMKELKEVRDEA